MRSLSVLSLSILLFMRKNNGQRRGFYNRSSKLLHLNLVFACFVWLQPATLLVICVYCVDKSLPWISSVAQCLMTRFPTAQPPINLRLVHPRFRIDNLPAIASLLLRYSSNSSSVAPIALSQWTTLHSSTHYSIPRNSCPSSEAPFQTSPTALNFRPTCFLSTPRDRAESSTAFAPSSDVVRCKLLRNSPTSTTTEIRLISVSCSSVSVFQNITELYCL